MDPDSAGTVLRRHRHRSGFPSCIAPPGNLMVRFPCYKKDVFPILQMKRITSFFTRCRFIGRGHLAGHGRKAMLHPGPTTNNSSGDPLYAHGPPDRRLRHRLREMPSNEIGELPERPGWLRPEGEPLLRDRHLRVPKRGEALLRLQGVPLPDHKKGTDRLRLLRVHLREGLRGRIDHFLSCSFSLATRIFSLMRSTCSSVLARIRSRWALSISPFLHCFSASSSSWRYSALMALSSLILCSSFSVLGLNVPSPPRLK